MGMAEDMRKWIVDMQQTLAQTRSDTLNREEVEKFKAQVGQFVTKLDGMAKQLGDPLPILPQAQAEEEKRRAGGPQGSR